MAAPNDSKKNNAVRAWLIVLAIFIAGIAMAWTQNKVLPVIGLVQVDLNVSAGIAGWISGIFNVLGIVLAFPAVAMVRKWGVVKGGVISIAVTLIGAVIGFFAGDEYMLLVSRVIEGFGISLISIIAPSTISMWFPSHKRSFPMGIWSSWQMVAIAGGFLLTGSIIGPDAVWKHMWIVSIILLALGIILFAAIVRTPPADENYADVEDTSIKITEVFKYKAVYIIGIIGIGFGVAIMTFATWIATYWTNAAGLDPAVANSIVGYVYLAEIFTAMIGGWILTRFKSLKSRHLRSCHVDVRDAGRARSSPCRRVHGTVLHVPQLRHDARRSHRRHDPRCDRRHRLGLCGHRRHRCTAHRRHLLRAAQAPW